MEVSNLFVELGSDCNATGSSSWAFGGAHVMASVYGPKEAILPVSGLHTPFESDMEFYLQNFLERLIDVKVYPRNQFAVRVQIISGVSGHPNTMAACINALSLALLSTSIPLQASIVAVCSSEIDPDSRPVMVALDISHSAFGAPSDIKRIKKENDDKHRILEVFAVYCGRPGSAFTADKASFPSSHLLALTTDLDSQGHLCSRARDLFEAMVTQLTGARS
ncbi:Exosome complex component Rrp41 [Taenia crassiceps]|uniref:Exosome complex component Rrp41 n=1 Tax=Taenia crassiceps TaxID=6207 RepID=A0ABR4Q9Z3_9CEST